MLSAKLTQSYLIRVGRRGVSLEIKRDLKRFEDPHYDFQLVDFAGIPAITVESFRAYCVYDTSFILLTIKPQVALTTLKDQKA
jgi:hypothetical protein